MRGVYSIAGQEVDDDRLSISKACLAQQLGRSERQEPTYTGGQSTKRPNLRDELGDRLRFGGYAHDHRASVVEVGQCGVIPTRGTFGERTYSDDPDPGKSRGDRRG